jgi:hypothetical protein
MKCANPECNRGIGLVSHRRGWLDKRRYCSKACRDSVTYQVTKQRRLRRRHATASYFEWLFSQPITSPEPRLVQASVRVKPSRGVLARHVSGSNKSGSCPNGARRPMRCEDVA